MTYNIPDIELLEDFNEDRPVDDRTTSATEEEKSLIEIFFLNYGFNISVIDIKRGLITTIYEIKLEKKTRFKDIKNLKEDLKLELKTKSLTISQSAKKIAINLEVPVIKRPIIPVKRVISSQNFRNHSGNLPVVLGLDINNSEIIFDVTKMPHLLVAGATGSGKSVCLNVILMSLILSKTPEDLKIVLIDPKRVELSLYSNIPFLLNPIVHEADESYDLLKALVGEMEKRYILLQQNKCRNIVTYNQKNSHNRLPYIVVMIDEFADLMLKTEIIEDPICRLAQLARSVGIHLIIATQRPSVDIITGRIKANFPSRIAFQVSSGVDSKVILDTVGAEDLVGRGDFLFKDSSAKGMIRGQCCFVHDDEIERVTADINIKDEDIQHIYTQTEKPERKSMVSNDEKSMPWVKVKTNFWSKVLLCCYYPFKEYFKHVFGHSFAIRLIFLLVLLLLISGGFNFEKIIIWKYRFFTEKSALPLIEGKYLPEVKKTILKLENENGISFTSYNGSLYIIKKNEPGEDVIVTDDTFMKKWKELTKTIYTDIRIISEKIVLSTTQESQNESHIFIGEKKYLQEQKSRKLTYKKCINKFPSYWADTIFFISNKRGKLFELYKLKSNSGKPPGLIKFPYNINYAGMVKSGILPLEANDDIFVYDFRKNIFYNITGTVYKEYSPSVTQSGNCISYIRKREDNSCQILLNFINTGETRVLILPDIHKDKTFIKQVIADSGNKLFLLTKNQNYSLFEINLKKD